MRNILLSQKNISFEYDARALAAAFYPDADIVTEGEAEQVIDVDALCRGAASKNDMRKALYDYLSARTGRTLPWGVLTGVRPTKLAMAKLRELSRGAANAGSVGADSAAESRFIVETAQYMREQYLVSPEKSVLAAVIAARELKVTGRLTVPEGGKAQDAYSLYVGIPFCPSRCSYCSFASNPIDKRAADVAAYLCALFKELEATAGIMKGRPMHSVYIGGGTPSALCEEDFERLLAKVCGSFDTVGAAEFTVEAGRPDSITAGKLSAMKRYGVTRISVNPQTMNDETLARIGRKHSVEQFVRAFGLAREAGFDNINTDIILGLAGEKPEDVAHTIRELSVLAPESLTVHALAIKRASRMNIEAEGRAHNEISADGAAEMMRISSQGAAAMGLVPYYMYRQKNMAGALENVGYAREGFEGIYNILMMEEMESIAACGAGTVTKIVRDDGTIERCDTAKDLDEYIKRIDEMIERKRKLFA